MNMEAPSSSPKANSRKVKSRHSLSATLFLWFMLLSLVPIGVVGVIEYREGSKSILSSRYEQLSVTNLLLSKKIDGYFGTIVTNLYIKYEIAQKLLANISKSYAEAGQPLKEFISSDDYKKLMSGRVSVLTDFLRYYDYSDLLLGDANGNILFSVNGYNDLGTNLFEGELRHTAFSKGSQQALESQELGYIDVAAYPPVGDQKVSFFVLPIMTDQGETIGFVALQILAYNIQSIFETDKKLGTTLKSYLVGRDFLIRYGTGIKPSDSMVLKSENKLTSEWLDHLSEGGKYLEFGEGEQDHESFDDHDHDHDIHTLFEELEIEDKDSELMSDAAHIREYSSVHGEAVLGTYHPINIVGTPMALVSEVSQDTAFASVYLFRDRLLFIVAVTFIIVFLIVLFITRRLSKPLKEMTNRVNKIASGDYTEETVLNGYREIQELSYSFKKMTDKLRRLNAANINKSWRQDGIAGLHECIRDEQNLMKLCNNIISYMARYLSMQAGAMYVMNDENILQLMGSYSWSKCKEKSNTFDIGEGIVGQAAMERRTIELHNLPEDYMLIQSGLGQTPPRSIIVIPLVFEDQVKGVIEFALIKELNEEQKQFIEFSMETIAIGLYSAIYRNRVNQLLNKTTKQAEAMKEQQEELRAVNEELESRALVLEESQEELKAQSEELQKFNAELEESTEQLHQQKEEIELKNLDIEMSRKTLEEKAVELEQASKYKSEFLANMSHELRTPLNSLLLLSQMLASNDDGNLSEDEVESASVILNSGRELLGLINDILDLSKVEAGKMSVNLENVNIEEICLSAKMLFKPLADDKRLDFDIAIEPNTPRTLFSDSQRVMQVIKNFLSNAFKFTTEGGVYINVSNSYEETKFGESNYVAFSVRDTGIGIPEEKQSAIFEAFQQADGSTSRQYGGTGLGLAISRELSSLLGGFIDMKSEAGKGTTFTLYLPGNTVCSLSEETAVADTFCEEKSKNLKEKDNPEPKGQGWEKPALMMGNKTVLIIEDDEHFSGIVSRLSQSHGYQCLLAKNGAEGLELAKQHYPQAIILDLGLPDMDGEEVLRLLKESAETKDIPVHIVSCRDSDESCKKGAVGYLVKPVTIEGMNQAFTTLEQAISKDIKHVLLLDRDVESRSSLAEMLTEKGVNVAEVSTAKEAEASLLENKWQCVVLDVDLPDSSGLEFLEKLQEKMADAMPYIVIHTDKKLSKDDQAQYLKYTQTLVVKGDYAFERVLDEVCLFFHSIRKFKSKNEQETVPAIKDKSLNGHKVLLVDDDLRNTFALSKGLQSEGLEVVIADNGQKALDKLDDEEGIELVLMDIMMPVMDGYEAMAKMRADNVYKDMPVIALTAKAMSDDRAKCIDLGANDYMTKPIDLEKLIEMIKVWLFK